MKLNIKNTVLIGFAFLSICAFWQMYDGIIPKILTETFHMSETLSGAIMAADNVLALFLLPLFGGFSDKCQSKLGKRRPFLLGGTLAAASLMLLLPLIDNSYYAAPAAYKLVLFVCVLGLILIAMGTYRSPAVALMPDVTPKPLRSKGNAIINLMGAVGGILYLIITTVLYSKSRTEGLDHISYLPLFAIVAAIMLIALFIVMTCVNEPKLAREQAAFEAQHIPSSIWQRRWTNVRRRFCPSPLSGVLCSFCCPLPSGTSDTMRYPPGLPRMPEKCGIWKSDRHPFA